jgi:hypothetical protein
MVTALTLFTFVARLKFQVLAAFHKDKYLDFFFLFCLGACFILTKINFGI